MNENISTVEEALRLRFANSTSQKALAKVAREAEATFLATQKELHPCLHPEEARKVYSDLIEDAQNATVLEKALHLAGKSNASREDNEIAKQRARVLLHRAFRPYVDSVVELLKGALDEVTKVGAEIERDEARLFQKWGCQPTATYLRIGAQRLAERLREQIDIMQDTTNPNVRIGRLTHWIRYGAGEA